MSIKQQCAAVNMCSVVSSNFIPQLQSKPTHHNNEGCIIISIVAFYNNFKVVPVYGLAPRYEEVEGSGGTVADLQSVTSYTDIIVRLIF